MKIVQKMITHYEDSFEIREDEQKVAFLTDQGTYYLTPEEAIWIGEQLINLGKEVNENKNADENGSKRNIQM